MFFVFVNISAHSILLLQCILLNHRYRKQLSGRTNGFPRPIFHRVAYSARGAIPSVGTGAVIFVFREVHMIDFRHVDASINGG